MMQQSAFQLGNAFGDALRKMFNDSEDREREEALAAQRAQWAEAERLREEQRRREEAERRRIEEERRQRELLEQMRVARIRQAARMRDDWERRDAEMTKTLDGVLDVVRPRNSTPFFGTPEEMSQLRDAPTDHPIPKIPSGGALAELEAQLRQTVSNRTWTQISPETTLVIGGSGGEGVANDPSVVDLRNASTLTPPVRIGSLPAAPSPPQPLINPLREPERWNAFVRQQRAEHPDLYASLDRYHAEHPLILPTDDDMKLLFMEPSIQVPDPKDVEFLFQDEFTRTRADYRRLYEEDRERRLWDEVMLRSLLEDMDRRSNAGLRK